jgi:glycosyltransferase involved in cell wall biosynthesis
MFSILATDYQPSVSDEVLQRFIDSLKAQTFKDFEVIIFHDGELERERKVNTEGLKVSFYNSTERGNKWGHNHRTTMMLLAEGDYFLNTNTDNVYCSDALETLNKVIFYFKYKEVFIMKVRMIGMNLEFGKVWYDKPRNEKVWLTLRGNPVRGSIDMMQLVTSRKVWEELGYWYREEEDSDGHIYESMCQKYEWIKVDKLIGEHY